MITSSANNITVVDTCAGDNVLEKSPITYPKASPYDESYNENVNECEKELLFAIDDTPESIPKIISNNKLAEFEREVKFEGCPTKILIDSGASVNILNLQTLRKIENFAKKSFQIIPTHT